MTNRVYNHQMLSSIAFGDLDEIWLNYCIITLSVKEWLSVELTVTIYTPFK